MKNWGEKKEMSLWFLTRKWKVGSWWIKLHNSWLCKDFHRNYPSVTAFLLRGQWFVPNFFLFALPVERVSLRFALAWLSLFKHFKMSSSHEFWFESIFFLKNEEISTKFLWDLSNRLSQKKIKALTNTFWGDFKTKIYVLQT